ncbi:hypothetical protein LYNGBM3L_03120 [Moorena producens 3L]|uniref:Uncharacterized protein n=2 Tax=Moorena producens TaxID=1155739 RepID=A0A1D9G966_MOOP1|nr:hypothetical protein LYNGBM3L_03120 [Moorena producens 3L]OLT68894.1 hypothetical protein BI334_31250 [Moorena producens 3L]
MNDSFDQLYVCLQRNNLRKLLELVNLPKLATLKLSQTEDGLGKHPSQLFLGRYFFLSGASSTIFLKAS